MSGHAPEPALYSGSTVHARPDGRSRFRYRLFSILVDIDAPRAGSASKWLLGFNKGGLLSFYDKDHGDRSGAPLRPWAEAMFASAGLDLDGGPIRLLAMPRVLGFVFNPISVFFGYGPDHKLRGVIYEVNNTFGETHCYVAPTPDGGANQHSADKAFHVSPFFDLSGRYDFTLEAPGDAFRLRIVKQAAGKPDHVALWTAKRRSLTNANILSAWLNAPLLTFWVVFSIHWQALRVWLRGARYHRKPAPPPTATTAARPSSSLKS